MQQIFARLLTMLYNVVVTVIMESLVNISGITRQAALLTVTSIAIQAPAGFLYIGN
jgi:ABC-type multidrug transport system permease subunit